MFSASKSGQYTGYQISRSVRLRSSASAYFNFTFISPTNTTTKTISLWLKRGVLGVEQYLWSGGSSGLNEDWCRINADNTITVQFSGGTNGTLTSTPVWRDPSGWYHMVFAIDTTQGTPANRVKLWVNNQSITFSGTQNGSSLTGWMINTQPGNLMRRTSTGASYMDGYLAEVYGIDGQALTPSSFGQYNAYGVWSPTKYNGTYGTNGFYLNFSDNSAATAAAIGKDYSGNGNNWTPNNITLSPTTSTSYDSMLDVPTQWADGGNGRGNYAVVNPLSGAGTALSVTSGNLNFSQGSSAYGLNVGSMSIKDKTYFEINLSSSATGVGRNSYCGVGSSGSANSYSAAGFFGTDASAWSLGYSNTTAYISNNGTQNAQAGTVANSDVFMFAVDPANGRIWFGRNGTWYAGNPAAGTGASYTNLPSEVFPVVQAYNSGAHSINFGQRPFSYTPPSGFKALNTLNLPTPTINNGALYMAASIYTGTGANLSITNTVNNVSFQPDLVWIKSRSNALDHKLTDSVRGTTKALISNTTGAETTDTTGLTAFNSNGFTVGTGTQYNANASVTYVGWQWKEGATQGFDIVTYTGDGGTQNISHNLGVAPRMMIVKSRSVAQRWTVYHASVSNAYLYLNETFAADTANAALRFGNNSAVVQPTSSVFTIGNSVDVNQNTTTYVAYLFAAIAGYSAFGSYTGNGSADGPFVFCGFRPRFILWKQTSAAGQDWQIEDTSREPYNSSNRSVLFPDLSNAEITDAYPTDFLSNGFKIRNAGNGNNQSGQTYIYAAFAENPLKFSLAR